MAARREGGVWINDEGLPSTIVSTSSGGDVAGSGGVASLSGSVSTTNSSTDPLDAAEEFTGAWVTVTNYEAITAVAAADVDSATDGLIVELSPDQVTVVYSQQHTVLADATDRALVVPAVARYARVRYINGATGQGSFALTTLLKPVFSILPPTLGQQLMVASNPVVLASDQSAIDINQLHQDEDAITIYGKSYNIVTVNLTASGSPAGAPAGGNQIIAAPATGFHLVVKFLYFSLADSVPVTAAVRAGAGGGNLYTSRLQYQGQAFAHSLQTTEWHLAASTALFGNLSGALADGGVHVTVEFETRVNA